MRRTIALLAALSCLVGGSTAVAAPGGGATVPGGVPAGGGAMPADSSSSAAAEPIESRGSGATAPQATPAQADDSPSSPGAGGPGDGSDEPVLGGDEEVGIVVPLPDDDRDEQVPAATPTPEAGGGLPITGFDAIALALAGAALLLLGAATHGATRGTSASRRPRVAARARGRA